MKQQTKILVLILFFFSGACTLIYQVAWVRMLVLSFGTSVFAVSTVLTAFMAGLTLGSVWFGRVADRREDCLRLYALLELGIGLFALTSPFILYGLDEVYTVLYHLLQGSEWAFALVRFVLSFLVLLVPTTLMGATLPVLVRAVVRRLERSGLDIGRLYAVNTLGAAAGAFAAAFVLLEYLGVMGTVHLAAGANLVIAAVAFWWSGRSGEVVSEGAGTQEHRGSQEGAPGRISWLVLAGFALSGFAALGYEVLWTRLLSLLLISATAQSLSTILVTFLFGLAVGGAVGAKFVDRRKDLVALFGVIELLLGFFGLVSIGAFGGIPYLLDALISFTSWQGYLFKLFAAAFGIMLAPTLLMGALFPVVGRLHALRLENLGRRIGDIYAINTLGAIFGAFGAGFVLLPLLGTQKSLEVLAWINIAVGAILLAANPAMRPVRKAGLIGALVAPVLLLAALLPAGLFGELFQWSESNSRLLYADEAPGGTVTVHETRDGKRILKVNGGGEVPTDYASIQTFRLLGNLPMILHLDPREVLVIAFGGGITLAAAERHKPERLDCVEIIPGVFEAARYFAQYNRYVFKRFAGSRLEAIVDDGRNHVLRTGRRYDVIIGDATHPGTADSWVLYTEEFYQLCQKRLKQGGIVAQWLPLHGLSVEDYKMILRTFRAVYAHATLWLTRDYSILLGTPGPLRIDFEVLRQQLKKEGIGADLREVDLGDPVSFLSAFALGEEAIGRFVGAGHTNTDDRPHISFSDRKRRGTGAGLPVLEALGARLAESMGVHLVNAGVAAEEVGRRLRGRNHTVQGDIALLQKDRERAAEAFGRAVALDPGERGAMRALRRFGAVE